TFTEDFNCLPDARVAACNITAVSGLKRSQDTYWTSQLQQQCLPTSTLVLS
ncbi:hypothetical protein ATANTOWER_014190, partial [Ataeniobius toweri]|nr:hypothetical protein [Ataeniobius toweri]